jgi:hypothetical protein
LGFESLDASEELGDENVALCERRFKLGDAKIAWVGRLHTQLGSCPGSVVNNSLQSQERVGRERLRRGYRRNHQACARSTKSIES